MKKCGSSAAKTRTFVDFRCSPAFPLAVAGLFVLFIALPLRAELSVIDLYAADATQIAATLQPLLEDSESISAYQGKLVINAPSHRLAEIRALIAQLDAPPQDLVISVRQGAGDLGLDEGITARGVLGVNDGEVRARGRVNVYSTRTSRDRRNEQFIRGLEGRPAYIETGVDLPVIFQQWFLTPRGVVTQPSIEYDSVGTGFYAVPRVSGSRVTLELSPYLDDVGYADGSGPVRRDIHTQVSGRLGEWIHVGGSRDEAHRDGSEIIGRTRKTTGRDYSVWVKVEKAPR